MNDQSLTQKYTFKLLEEIKHGIYSNTNILPPEVDIADYFSVSRTIIRDCLSILDREGFVNRKRGIGTIINRHVLAVKIRIDLEAEFLDMIRAAGYTPSVDSLEWGFVEAPEHIASKLNVKPLDKLFVTYRVICAEGEPVIYCEDYIPEALIKKENYSDEILKRPIFDFLNECCSQDVYMDLTEITAIIADDKVIDKLKLDKEEKTPVLHLNECGYSFLGQAILYSDEYYKSGKLTHTILRKKI